MSLRNSLSTAELNWYERLNAAHRRAAEFLRADRTILADAERLAGALMEPCEWANYHTPVCPQADGGLCDTCALRAHWNAIVRIMESQP